MQDLSALILRLYLFPGRRYQKFIDIKLMEEVFPVIDPVFIFRLGNRDRSFPDIHKHTQVVKLLLHALDQLRQINCLPAAYQKVRVVRCPIKSLWQLWFFIAFFRYFHKKAQVCHTVICWSIRQNIHEHLLLFPCGKRHFILNLCTFQPQIVHRTDDDILCLGSCLYH